jgi:D-arabinose 1-dehydrogenase-like Zn-dependent alcohol dehydrogenase
MRAARVTEYKTPYKIESIPIPKAKANQLLVKTGAAGFCHTGMSIEIGTHWNRFDDSRWRFSFTITIDRKS